MDGTLGGSRRSASFTALCPFQPTTVGANAVVSPFCFPSSPDVPPTVASVVVTGGDEATRSEPEVGAEAAANNLGEGGATPSEVETRPGGGGGAHERPLPQAEVAPMAAEGPQVAGRKRRRIRAAFTPLQVQELETFFHRGHYPDLFQR